MKKICILLSVMFISCSTYKRERFDYNFGENRWVNSYKTDVFFACIKKAYKSDSLFKLIEKKDFFSLAGNPQIDEMKESQKLGEAIINNIPKPIYPECDDCNQEEELKKNYFCAVCLNYYASRELDSIAKKAYKKHVKMN